MMGPKDQRQCTTRLLKFARLVAAYVPQHNERSCSLASITMLVNGARAAQNQSACARPLTQARILDEVGDDAWKAAVDPEGGDGVALETLADLVGRSLEAVGIARFTIDVIHVDRVANAVRAKVRQVLTALACSPNRFLLANFLQSVYVGNRTSAIGHHAPVAGYDARRRRVFILDPDQHLAGPYWVSEDRFLKGMATRDESCGKSRGYVSVRVE